MSHPHDKFICNGIIAKMLIFFSRYRIPLISRAFNIFLGCDIGCRLPKSTFLPHPYGIIVHSGALIGEYVVIGHQVTIGARNGVNIAPKIGDYVIIGAGAKILGDIVIGNNVMIGANAVVTKKIPDNKKVVGANRIL